MTPTGRLASVGACQAPTTPNVRVAYAAEKAAWAGHAWSSEERCLRALLTNHGFTISVFAAAAIAAMIAYPFGASQELAAPPLLPGFLTAVAECVFHSSPEHQP